ncbi:MAG: hypothetical protein M3R70_12395 [Actinomycetota bacterium]|nr:hypothetical protein [Actinomycetota bacterium]
MLQRTGRKPLKTAAIFSAIKKGGVQIGAPATLYRSLDRDNSFFNTGRGNWGLSEWYSEAVRRKAKGEDHDDLPDDESGDDAGQELEENEEGAPAEADTP